MFGLDKARPIDSRKGQSQGCSYSVKTRVMSVVGRVDKQREIDNITSKISHITRKLNSSELPAF